MKLYEVISQLDKYSDDQCIYAAQSNGTWFSESDAFVVPNPEDGATTQIIDGITAVYFLEVFLAKEILEDWGNIAGKLSFSNDEKFMVALYYAKHDTWPDPSAVDEERH